jgi:cobalt-zinc-cadmium efflux system outer membrane protein
MNSRLFKIIPILMVSLIAAQERSIDFQNIENLIIEHSPELRALEENIEAYRGNLRQSSLFLNPELDLESITGYEAETAAQISQTVELGRKRFKRSQVAELELEKSILSSLNKKSTILFDAKLVFIDILLAQQTLSLKKETVKIAENFLLSVQKRVVAGSLSPAEEARAQIALANRNLDLNRAQKNLENYWNKLSSFWANASTNYSYVIGDLENIPNMPSKETLLRSIIKSPTILEKNLELQIQQALVEVEKANKIPDINFNAGISKTEDANNSYIAGFSIPLRVFDRNQGTIQATNAQLNQISEEKLALEIDLEADISSIYSDLEIINKEIDALKRSIIPSAERAYQIITEGYLQGKFGFLDVVDSQSTLFEAEESYWSAIANYKSAIARIEVLLGQTFESFIN